jgi:hypothetical protein
VSAFLQVQLKSIPDDRGNLIVLQNDFPFEIRRLYWIVGAGGQRRGGHRHRETRQGLIAIQGDIVVNVDDGTHAAEVRLDSPSVGLLVEPEDWHTMHFGPDAILLVVASHEYDAADYVHEPYQLERLE